MSDGHTARFPQRLRALFVAASVLVSAPILLPDPAVLSATPARAVMERLGMAYAKDILVGGEPFALYVLDT